MSSPTTAMAPSPTVCPECGDTFQDLRGLNGHLRFKHDMPAEKARMVMEETKREDEEIDVGDELLKLMDQLDDLEEKKKRAKKRKRKATGVLPTMTDKDQKRAAEKVLERLEEKEERIRKRMRTLTGDEESEDASDPLKFLWE